MSTQGPSLVVASNSSWVEVRREERRLCAIIESPHSSEDDRYQAILDLAKLTGMLAHPLADVA